EPLDGIERRVRSRLHAGERERERLPIVGEGMRGAAKHVPRKLIEHDDEAKEAAGTVGPGIQPTLGGTLDEPAEALGDLLVAQPRQLRRLAVPEPCLHALFERCGGECQRAKPELPKLPRLVHDPQDISAAAASSARRVAGASSIRAPALYRGRPAARCAG